MIYVLLISFGLLGLTATYIILWPELIRVRKEESVLHAGLIYILITLGGVLFGAASIPFYIYHRRKTKSYDRTLKSKLISADPRKLNPGLYKLFLSEGGFGLNSDDEQIHKLKSQYQKDHTFAFTIIYDYSKINCKKLIKLRELLNRHVLM